MKNKNLFRLSAIILIVIGVVLISLSFMVSDKKEMDNNKPNNDSDVEEKPSEPDDNKPSITYETVLNMAESLYGGDDFAIAVKEEEDKFIIERTYKSNGNVEIYFVDKVTGSIYSEDAPSEG